jgi:DNA-directed RNA polymerase specialized sigma24 family protein
MTNKEKIKYLRQYRSLTREIIENENRYAELTTRLIYPKLPKLSDMPKGSRLTHDPMADGVCQLTELESILIKQQDKLINTQKEIQQAIEGLEDSLHRRLVRLYYIDGLTWEKVCVDINYSWRQTHRLHSEALKKIKIQGGNKND